MNRPGGWMFLYSNRDRDLALAGVAKGIVVSLLKGEQFSLSGKPQLT